jgi:hypothetical protein
MLRCPRCDCVQCQPSYGADLEVNFSALNIFRSGTRSTGATSASNGFGEP